MKEEKEKRGLREEGKEVKRDTSDKGRREERRRGRRIGDENGNGSIGAIINKERRVRRERGKRKGIRREENRQT